MKLKPINYMLILGVIAIWAIIIRNILIAGDDKSQVSLKSSQAGSVSIQQKWYMKTYTIDTISLKLPINDPFIKQEKKIALTVEPTPIVPQTIPAAKAPLIWPTISFEGFVEKQARNSSRYAVLNINGQPAMLAGGATAFGVRVVKNWGDSLLVSYENRTKKIYLNTK